MKLRPGILNLLSLEGKTACVTGAGSGIGFASACRLAAAGACVALLDIDARKGQAAASKIRKIHPEAKFYRCDVSLDASCEEVVSRILEDFGKIDILVNNAGIIKRQTLVETTEEDWDAVLGLNLKSVFLLSRRIIPVMEKGGGGSIVNIGSGWGLKGGPRAAAYCASKAGIVNLTRAMAIDHGPHNIRVNCVCPGDVLTDLLRKEAAQLNVAFRAFKKEAARRP
ncbi:MAG: SDR family NAD(P)-dependent oxidoreductase, partial [Candidatus Aminicenantales bacterium]